MKASELIGKLIGMISEHGDLPVKVFGGGEGWEEVDKVENRQDWADEGKEVIYLD